jgi:DNA-binding PadR family transcriptional regulator
MTPPLANNSAAVLGMVALGAPSGYQIRRAAALSLRFFWALGPPQIYSELNRLESAGLVSGEDDSQGQRRRRRYELTSDGRAALERWAAANQAAPLELRDALLLQLFFADAAGPATIRTLLARIRERSEQALGAFGEQIMPAAAQSERLGFQQPRLVAEFGEALHRFIVGWCDERLADA